MTSQHVHVGDAKTMSTDMFHVAGNVDLVVTSPPYFGLRTYGLLGEIGSEATPAEYVDSMMHVLSECADMLTPIGSVFLVIGDKYARTGGVDKKQRGGGDDPGGRTHSRPVQRGVPGVKDGSLIGLPFRVALAAIEQGWVWRQEIVWAKPNPLPESVKSRSRRSHETILHLARTNRPYAAESAAETLDVWSHAVQGYRDPQGRKHPAVFPESIARRIIQHYCPPGGLVLDPFAGTGTTLVAAKALGFDALGVELNPEYAAIARDRLTP